MTAIDDSGTPFPLNLLEGKTIHFEGDLTPTGDSYFRRLFKGWPDAPLPAPGEQHAFTLHVNNGTDEVYTTSLPPASTLAAHERTDLMAEFCDLLRKVTYKPGASVYAERDYGMGDSVHVVIKSLTVDVCNPRWRCTTTTENVWDSMAYASVPSVPRFATDREVTYTPTDLQLTTKVQFELIRILLADREQFNIWLVNRFDELERHERAEFLRVDGVRVTDPHPELNRPAVPATPEGAT